MAINLATDFGQYTLSGASINNPTSMQFGPDGRLYVAQQDGIIKCFTVQRTATGYQVTSTETISLIKTIPNHNDDGSLNTALTSRQVTGLLVTGTATQPVIYVGSSDPRIAGSTDSGLDTNSGIISRLTLTGTGQWDKLDLVRGLPRSEENHSVNGLQYDETTNQLYVAVGGNTNMGAPSSNFGYLPEYAYSAAILKVDLNALEGMTVKTDSSSGTPHKYLHDLPTLNDPTRSDGSETVFGGNDGLNMAKIVAGSPVQVYAPGFRNAYDFVIADTGKMYVMDNGPNSGWGGIPATGPNGVLNQGVNGGSTLGDTLHLVTAGYYGGHPNPIRANGAAAGLTDSDGTADGLADGALLPAGQLPSDFAQIVAVKNAKEALFKHPGGDAAALWTNGQSTNGLAQYTANALNGQLKGDLFTVGYGGFLYHLDLNSTGTAVQGVTSLSIGGTPLDVIAQAADQPFAGTIWVSKYGADQILILEPQASTTLPPGDDDDADGLSNTIDRFALDANNGTATVVRAGETLHWSLSAADPATPGPSNSLFAIGFTGLMADLKTPYAGLYDIENITPGGAAGVMTVDAVSAGTAQGALNSQHEAFQFGVKPAPGTTQFTVSASMDNPFDAIAIPANDQSQGLYIGSGDQDNYLQIAVHANGGAGGIQIVSENNGAVTKTMYAASGLVSSADPTDRVSLFLDVNVAAATVTPRWSYTTNDGAQTLQGQGGAIGVSGALLSALQGAYTVNGKASGTAVGIIATSAGEGGAFAASWDSLSITAPPTGGTVAGSATLAITAGSTIETSTYNANAFKITNTGQKDIVGVSFDTRTNVLPGIVFDPAGTAGDTTAKNLKIDSAGNTGVFQPAATDFSAFSVSNSGGYNVMSLSFSQAVNGGFDPGETVSFSVDIDPLNIKGTGITGDAGSISGLELAGTKVTVTYADGTTQTSEIIGDGSAGGGKAQWSNSIPSAPILTLAGKTSGDVAVTTPTQSVQVTGAPNSSVTVMLLTGGSGNNVQPTDAFDANKATAVEYRQVALSSTGQGSFSFTVPLSGPVFLAAAQQGTSGPGHVSLPLTVALASGGSTPPPSGAVAINSGGAAYTDADTGIAYLADTGQYANGGSTFTTTKAVSGTNDPSLYSNQRYNTGNLTYNIPVATGDYVVTMKFAEIYSGITVAGQRIFDVRAEGALVADDLDVFQRVGAYKPLDLVQAVHVSDGYLTLEFLKGIAQNPFVSAISIQPAGSPPPADITAPTASGGASDLTATGATHNATITWSDTGSGLNASTIGVDDILVTGGTSAMTVSAVSTSAGANGSIVAVYSLASPGGFTAADNGTYTISRVAGGVRDLAGNGAPAGTQDSFTVNIPGTPTANMITGTSGGETLSGTSGVDIVDALAGNDIVNGLAGADTLKGGIGADLLRGGPGADRLNGGAGNDRFAYASIQESGAGASSDIIEDFSRPQGDLIDLSGIDARPKRGDQAFRFIGENAFHGREGELRFAYGSDGYTHVYGDVDGNGVADFGIRLSGQHALVYSDFLL